ncbi:hypothetical protein H2200_009695 [Cladophialophora chaetospira]|uniref:Flavin reductase like domain-containing protein n=1 Tax=Cladophialophora chaetospira TaxID=386627 RepID=A0AA38X2X3_9EURO|nr:hypothetical protein H2200_009695 [Cladophialophora chaetospira]
MTSNPFLLDSRHGDFKKIQANRPDFDNSSSVPVTKSPNPAWKYGDGTNKKPNEGLQAIEIDPYHPDQRMISNYKLLISGIPRPISFVSTISKDGKENLAPFSYFQVVDHDPPILVIGFSARESRPKDTRKNLLETGECVVSVVTEHMIEAVNATSLDVPHGVSEWAFSGLVATSSSTVKPNRVKDAIFSMEGKLLEMKQLDYGHEGDGKPHGALAIIKVTRFWIREDALTEARDHVDLSKLRPLVQLGGISYGRVRETFELPRPRLEDEMKDESKGLRSILEGDAETQPALDPSKLPHEDLKHH